MGRECDQRGPWFGREWVVEAFGGVQRDDDSGEQRARRSRDPARPSAERVCRLLTSLLRFNGLLRSTRMPCLHESVRNGVATMNWSRRRHCRVARRPQELL
jgi:hypothetical protein